MRILSKRQLKELVCIHPSTFHDWKRPANSPSGYSLALAEWDGLRMRCWTGSRHAWMAARSQSDTPAKGAGGRGCKSGHPFAFGGSND